jgi:hypothetical protein
VIDGSIESHDISRITAIDDGLSGGERRHHVRWPTIGLRRPRPRQSCWLVTPASDHCMDMTTASPPRLSISPVRLAFRCMMTPFSFCIQRSPPLMVPIANP